MRKKKAKRVQQNSPKKSVRSRHTRKKKENNQNPATPKDYRREQTSVDTGPELVIGIVGAIGADLDLLCESLKDSLASVQYECETIRLSELLSDLKKNRLGDLRDSPLDERYNSYMDAGNSLRKNLKRGDAMALLGIGAIRETRKDKGEDVFRPLSRQAYILRSLKHPSEVETLRRIYGPAFLLIAAYAPREKRIQKLTGRIADSHHNFQSLECKPTAEKLLIRDEAERGKKYGQNVRKVFPLADMFIDVGNSRKCRDSVQRTIELLFGNTFHTPTKDEYGMFHAQAAALRSSSLQRQVGAVITTTEGDIIAVGTNEVPKAGGGLYWCEENPDQRDFRLGFEKNDQLKRRMFADVLHRLKEKGWLKENSSEETVESLVQMALNTQETEEEEVAPIKKAQLMNIIEFGRCVHAEMAALMDAARRGSKVSGCTLYSTTFPCHECARHIVAAGINRVVYIEPYPKSLVPELYPDSISVDGSGEAGQYVYFEPFVGIAPKQYMPLFRMTRRKDNNGKVIRWEKSLAKLRLGEYFPISPVAHLTLEQSKFKEFVGQLDEHGLK